jgi:hypothetical protein
MYEECYHCLWKTLTLVCAVYCYKSYSKKARLIQESKNNVVTSIIAAKDLIEENPVKKSFKGPED